MHQLVPLIWCAAEIRLQEFIEGIGILEDEV